MQDSTNRDVIELIFTQKQMQRKQEKRMKLRETIEKYERLKRNEADALHENYSLERYNHCQT